jgi:hypothetical protein
MGPRISANVDAKMQNSVALPASPAQLHHVTAVSKLIPCVHISNFSLLITDTEAESVAL